jgi:hypothetical protein
MAKRPRRPRSSDDAFVPGGPDAPDYEVGYGRPPTHTRFKPGQSGNPKGRPKKELSLAEALVKVLNQRVAVREGDRTRTLSKQDALVLTIVNAALKGNSRAWSFLQACLRVLDETKVRDQAADVDILTADYHGLLEDYIQRHMQDSTTPKDPLLPQPLPPQKKAVAEPTGSRKKA